MLHLVGNEHLCHGCFGVVLGEAGSATTGLTPWQRWLHRRVFP